MSHDPHRLKVLITGGGGYLGSKLVRRLADRADVMTICVDVREIAEADRHSGITYEQADVRAPAMADLIARHKPDVVIHLAAIVTPGKDSTREFEYSVDVGGTENVLTACVASGVRRIVVTSSGAAYGYFADNAAWLKETDPIRGNEEFPYAYHKRLVEERMKAYAQSHPELEQIIFRVCTIFGEGVKNQITNLFDKPRLPGVRGGDDRFVFIHDEDVVGCLEKSVDSRVVGIFNVAGDGALSMGELAVMMGKKYAPLPAGLVRLALMIAKPLGLSRYGPEQVKFLQYRPVLDNTRLKEVFGYIPRKTSREVFEIYLAQRRPDSGE